jgi:hypothetical protein
VKTRAASQVVRREFSNFEKFDRDSIAHAGPDAYGARRSRSVRVSPPPRPFVDRAAWGGATTLTSRRQQ